MRPAGHLQARPGALRHVAGRLACLVAIAGGTLVLGPVDGGAVPSRAAQDAPELPVSWAVQPAAVPGEPQRANFELEADPGETLQDRLVVENLGEVELVLGVYASDAFNTREGGIDLLAGGEEAVDVGAWVRAETPAITLAAGATTEIPFTVAVPADAASGDHVGGIVTSLTVSEPDAQGNRVKVERRLGTRVQVRVGGEVRPELTFTELEADHRANANPFAPGSMTVRYRVENTGNVRLRSTREVRVEGSFGAARVAQAADMPELLPDNAYEFTQRVAGVWAAFDTGIEVELRPYDPTGAQLDPAPGPVIGRTSRNLVPTSQIVLAVAVVLLVAVLVWRRRGQRRRLQAAVDRAVGEALGGTHPQASEGQVPGPPPYQPQPLDQPQPPYQSQQADLGVPPRAPLPATSSTHRFDTQQQENHP